MSDGSIWILIPLAPFFVGALAMVSKPMQRWIALQERKAEISASVAGEQAAQYAAKIERLEARVAVLDRIVTDRGTALADEIEALRPPAPARPELKQTPLN